jgi:hypothetical protein
MKLKHRLLAASLCVASLPVAAAEDIDAIQNLTQQEFRRFSEDLGAALSWKALTPTTPLGTTGFDIGLAVTVTKLEHRGLFEQAAGGDFPSVLPVPSLRLHKGLPLGIDIGLMAAAVPGSNIKLFGGEIRYALISGITVPSIGIRGSYTKLSGVDQLDFDTRGLDISISKGFAGFTPYAGIGRVWSDSEPDGSTGLNKESISQNKGFVGLNINLGITNLAAEVDRTGDTTTYGAKLGFRF